MPTRRATRWLVCVACGALAALGATPSWQPAPTPADTSSSPTPVAAVSPMPALPSADEVTNALAARFEATLNGGDVEGTMALFADDATVKVPPDMYVGSGQIRGWVQYLAANHFMGEPGLRHTSGAAATWPLEVASDQLGRLGLPSLDGAATLESRDGKIGAYTFVLSRDSASRLRAAQLAASEVLQDPVIVGLDSANVYGFNDVFRDGTGTLLSYRDVLTAEPGSGPFYDLGGQPIVIRTGI